MQMEAIRLEHAAGIGEERNPPCHAGLWHPQWEAAFVLPPDNNGQPLEHTVDLVTVAPGYLPADYAFQLAQGQCRDLRRIGVAALR